MSNIAEEARSTPNTTETEQGKVHAEVSCHAPARRDAPGWGKVKDLRVDSSSHNKENVDLKGIFWKSLDILNPENYGEMHAQDKVNRKQWELMSKEVQEYPSLFHPPVSNPPYTSFNKKLEFLNNEWQLERKQQWIHE